LFKANRSKRGYYIRRLKDGLWSTFGFNRIKPFGDGYTKDQMRDWKNSEDTKSVYDDLYKLSVPDDESSDTYLTLIIKFAFSEKKLTQKNAIWGQAVIESIFDVEHLSSKIDTDVVDAWVDAIGQVM